MSENCSDHCHHQEMDKDDNRIGEIQCLTTELDCNNGCSDCGGCFCDDHCHTNSYCTPLIKDCVKHEELCEGSCHKHYHSGRHCDTKDAKGLPWKNR